MLYYIILFTILYCIMLYFILLYYMCIYIYVCMYIYISYIFLYRTFFYGNQSLCCILGSLIIQHANEQVTPIQSSVLFGTVSGAIGKLTSFVLS